MSTKKTSKRRGTSDNESDFEASDHSQKRDVKSTKSKARSHNRDSDDADPPTVKKPRLSTSTTSQATPVSSKRPFVEIGKKKRVSVSVFKGQPLVDIREYYGTGGDEKPGKKGISLTVEQWEAIKSNIAAIDQLLSNLKE